MIVEKALPDARIARTYCAFLSPQLVNRAQRHSLACKYHRLNFEQSPRGSQRESSEEEASTSGQSSANIPSALEALIDSLPTRSKRRRFLTATSTFGACIARWKDEAR